MSVRVTALGWLAMAWLAPAQSLRVVSEFQRIDPFGQVVPADRAERPREILSPAVARDAWASFRMVVTMPQGGQYTLHVGQNPDDAVRVRVFRETYEKVGETWIPDRLTEVPLPFTGTLPDPAAGIAGQTTATFWLDFWVAPDAPVRRIKVEPQLWVNGAWIIYPMEVRVVAAVVPPAEPGPPTDELPPPAASADSAALGELRDYLCRTGGTGSSGMGTARNLVRRNAAQDMRLARWMERGNNRREFERAMLRAAPLTDPAAWCGPALPALPVPPEFGPEWYLRIRDFLYRGGLAAQSAIR